IPVFMAAFTMYLFRFQTQPDGKVLVFSQGGKFSTPASVFVGEMFQSSLMTTSGLWTFLGIFALAPLLSSYIESGIAGLLFTKGLSRSQILAGRVLGALMLFVATVAILDGLPAIYFWIRSGISPRNFLIAVS